MPKSKKKVHEKSWHTEPQRLDLRGQYYKVFACICAHHHKKHSTGHYLNLKRKPSYPVLSMSLLTSITVSCSVVRTEHTGFQWQKLSPALARVHLYNITSANQRMQISMDCGLWPTTAVAHKTKKRWQVQKEYAFGSKFQKQLTKCCYAMFSQETMTIWQNLKQKMGFWSIGQDHYLIAT